MQVALDEDGDFLFRQSECLESGQIKSLFSRFAKDVKKRGLKRKNCDASGDDENVSKRPNLDSIPEEDHLFENCSHPVSDDEVIEAQITIDLNERNNIECEILQAVDNDVIHFFCPMQVS